MGRCQRDAANLLWIWNWKGAARYEMQQDMRRSRGRRLGTPWPENVPKHRRRGRSG
jgi:hypothetical protein